MALYILIFSFLDSRRKDKKSWTELKVKSVANKDIYNVFYFEFFKHLPYIWATVSFKYKLTIKFLW
jgi:hypothetical protein